MMVYCAHCDEMNGTCACQMSCLLCVSSNELHVVAPQEYIDNITPQAETLPPPGGKRRMLGPSKEVVESLRSSVERRIAEHQRRLYKDPEESRDAINVLEQVQAERKGRAALRPRTANTNVPTRGATGQVVPASKVNGTRAQLADLSANATAAHHKEHHQASLLEFYDTTTDGYLEGTASLRDAPSISCAAEDAAMLEAENDAMELFLLRHGHGDAVVVGVPTSPGANHGEGTLATDKCLRSRERLQDAIDDVVARLEGMRTHATLSSPSASLVARQISRQASLSQTIVSLKEETDALLSECAILEAEVERYANASSGLPSTQTSLPSPCIPWLVAQSLLPHLPVHRSDTPLVTAGGWYRFASQSSRCNEISQRHTSHIDDVRHAAADVEQGLQTQLEMILRHMSTVHNSY